MQGASNKSVVECIDGARASLPEDCGGSWGYEDLLQALKDPKHEGNESAMEWLGEEFDPEAFDIEKANKFLRKL